MKHLRKITAVALSVMLLLCMCVSAFADTATTGTITLNGTTEDKEYRLYRVFDLTYTGEGEYKKVSYTISDNWKEFFEIEPGSNYLMDKEADGFNPITITNADGTAVTKYINITEANVADFAQDALGYAGEKAADKSVTAKGETAVAEELPLGYYLVYPVGATQKLENSKGSLCSLTSTVPNGTIEIKAEYPPFEKTVDDVKIEGVQIGQVLNYDLKGEIPDTTGYKNYTYEFSDKMSAGLTFNKNVTVKVAGVDITNIKDEETGLPMYYTITYNEINDGFTLSIDVMKLIDQTIAEGVTVKVNDPILVEYTAIANEQGLTKISRNEAKLTFSNDPATGSTDEIKDNVPVYTAKIVINKYDAKETSKKLSGAEFVLQNANEGDDLNKYYKYTAETETSPAKVEWVNNIDEATHVTTDENGAANFDGLVPGNYKLVETKAPDGYNLLHEPQNITIDKLADDTVINTATDTEVTELTLTAEVANSSGSELPGTGGIGTTVFYIVGGALALGAVILLVTKKRMSVEK
ncbi:MAG: SpaH/EbpB family LPXTG-anchored major pilin [Clostridiales bacterium]|nr:SpaH/EbpB family LPXTG-anchored major pilin [Clostridiales bacterium]